MESYVELFQEMGKKARKASIELGKATTAEKNQILEYMAAVLIKNEEEILAANKIDMEHAESNNVPITMRDRLELTSQRISQMAEGLRAIIQLKDPIHLTLEEILRPNGLQIQRVSVPLGVVAIIYEARPNVTVDAVGLCIKTGNAVILRGGKEALETNKKITDLLQKALCECGFSGEIVQLVKITEREAVPILLKQRRYIDVVIPRGGAGLIKRTVEESTIPVIETGSGICHTYIDEDADLEQALRVSVNAKVNRPSTCNTMETLLIHKNISDSFLSVLFNTFKENKVQIRGDENLCKKFPYLMMATEDDWKTEYNDYILSVKQVESLDEAIAHIEKYGTRHSECIITENKSKADYFCQCVDAAAVYVNASTRFTDGFEFGFGAEIGISTQKLHARGPMGLSALTTYKYVIHGEGQIRK